MRRLALILALLLVPASTALGADLGELLEQSREASFSAEQVIACSTPDGVEDAVIKLTQTAGELRVENAVDPGVVVSSGSGGWTVVREGLVVASVTVPTGEHVADPRYVVEDGEPVLYLGRDATSYRMVGDGLVRAELVFDDEVGALLRVATFTDEGELYCERRLISLEPIPAGEPPTDSAGGPDAPGEDLGIETGVETDLPTELAGFQLLDAYRDREGFTFAYYSDGFFSFAVFQTPVRIAVEDALPVDLEAGRYLRTFGPGQVTFAWETLTGGMALVGDLPPDMHPDVLAGLPHPQDPGFLRRLWRSLFG